MNAIMENIVREISLNDMNLQEEWIKRIRLEERKQKRAVNRFQRWQANVMDSQEASDYAQAVEECIRMMAKKAH